MHIFIILYPIFNASNSHFVLSNKILFHCCPSPELYDYEELYFLLLVSLSCEALVRPLIQRMWGLALFTPLCFMYFGLCVANHAGGHGSACSLMMKYLRPKAMSACLGPQTCIRIQIDLLPCLISV